MLELKNISKNYVVDKQEFPALKNVSIAFGKTGLVSILGPSGCGKTTLLNIIGGLDQYSSGDLIIDNKSTKDFTDRDWDAYRNHHIGFVFQSYNLVPHLSVIENVELSMTLTGKSKKAREKRAMYLLDVVGLSKMAKKKPNQLSGGQMQRVAIARALANKPQIILADEPTGALDSKTSLQVMEILKYVSKRCLVIMVTHNDLLAARYSTRLLRLKDGVVRGDTAPMKITSEDKDTERLKKDTNAKTHMSFLTAFFSSFKSLLTKKGRTALTIAATSFGIIGVAIVLAISNGFSNYVHDVEIQTAASVPISVAPFVTTSIDEVDRTNPWPDEHVLKPFNEDISEITTQHHNNITEEYLNYCKQLVSNPETAYASSVLGNHEYMDFNIFTKRENPDDPDNPEIIKVNQFAPAGAEGALLSGATSLPSTIFHELYGNKQYMDQLYQVIEGEYPREDIYTDDKGVRHCDVCLICDRYNRIPIMTLYELGLSPHSTVSEGVEIPFDKIIGHEYRAFSPSDVFKATGEITATGSFPSYTTIQGSQSSFCDLKDAGERPPIWQCADITERDPSTGAYIYKSELESLYGPDVPSSSDEYNPIVLKIVGIIRLKKNKLVNLIPGSVCYPEALKNEYIKQSQASEFKEYAEHVRNNWYIPKDEKTPKLWSDFVKTTLLNAVYKSSSLELLTWLNLGAAPIKTFGLFGKTKTDSNGNRTLELYQTPYGEFDDYLYANYRFSNNFKKPTFVYDDYEQTHRPIDVDMTDIESPLQVINYAVGYSTITSIMIFPKDFASKQQIFNYLDQWNKDHPENVIKYTDLAGTVTRLLGNLIQIISIVLLAFSAVSLLVSCVMTGIITYTSVLERTKEIGILRAIGARKKDVGRLFEAESTIIGLISGLVGVLFTFIIEWPISLGFASMFPRQNVGMICNLHPGHAALLIVISGLLTLVAGFFPARIASKKNPVTALRTE
ncbi:MAG: ABC transporter ATP-binding protein/permease [Bacilli bacterium]|nr:ABC transporter ATP-binding protein/permease [Bacilli bacterium]